MAYLNRGLIVSCQAVKGEPLYGLGIMKYMARAAVQGGAVGIGRITSAIFLTSAARSTCR